MTEQSFTEKIRRENRWKWLTATFTTAICVAFVFAHLMLAVDQGMLRDRSFLYVFFVQSLVLVLASGVSWAMRDAQRHDLYVEIRRHSLTQLKRFRSEIDDEIERLEEDLVDEKQAGKKIRRIEGSG